MCLCETNHSWGLSSSLQQFEFVKVNVFTRVFNFILQYSPIQQMQPDQASMKQQLTVLGRLHNA